jgi:DUF971 family protein
MIKPVPLKIRRAEGNALSVEWSDGKICLYPFSVLRKKCPCASCVSERDSSGASFIPLFTKDALTLDRIVQAGSYAIQLYWKDGHDTGIYDFDFLSALCPKES